MSILNLLDVCCVVPKVYLANPKKNAKEIIKEINKNQDKEIILFPELSITGYTCGDLFFQSALLSNALEALNSIKEATKTIDSLVVVGIPISYSGKIYNCCAAIQSDKILCIIPKTYIPENKEYYEKRWFTSGRDINTEITIGDTSIPFTSNILLVSKENNEIKVGIEICEDLWAPDPPSVKLAKAGGVIILNASASNETIAKDKYRTELISQQSARLNCAYLYASCGYGESTQDLVFSGDALIAEKGKILARSKRFQIDTFSISAQIDVEGILHDRRIESSYRDSESIKLLEVPVSLKTTDKLTRSFEKNPFVPSNQAEREERSEEILNIQSLGLGTRLKSISDDTNLIVGISGGLDSTLALIVAKLTCDKFGIDPSHIKAITMPGFGTTDRTYNNAKELIELIGAEFIEIPIGDSVLQHFKDIGHPIELKNEVYENAQARERTQILMDYANKVGGIVVGTGDLSELALGWATYNGDHMSMYGVNAGVPKTLVRYLVQFYADQNEGELKKVLYDILNTPVSPELLPPDENGNIAQKTEEKIGPYELHDFFLFHHLRNGYSPRKIFRLAKETFNDEYTPEYIMKWLKTFYRRFFSQQFKRSALPDGPKVGSVTLSPRGDWRMPSDVHSDTWLEELEEEKI